MVGSVAAAIITGQAEWGNLTPVLLRQKLGKGFEKEGGLAGAVSTELLKSGRTFRRPNEAKENIPQLQVKREAERRKSQGRGKTCKEKNW